MGMHNLHSNPMMSNIGLDISYGGDHYPSGQVKWLSLLGKEALGLSADLHFLMILGLPSSTERQAPWRHASCLEEVKALHEERKPYGRLIKPVARFSVTGQ